MLHGRGPPPVARAGTRKAARARPPRRPGRRHTDTWRGRREPSRTLIDAARVELAPRGIRFTSIHPGFVATERINGDGLPKPFQISQERAARLVVRALEREPAQAYFPWPTAALVRTLRTLPTPVSSAVLRRLASP